MKLKELKSEKLKEVISAGDLAEISGAIDGILEAFLIEGSK